MNKIESRNRAFTDSEAGKVEIEHRRELMIANIERLNRLGFSGRFDNDEELRRIVYREMSKLGYKYCHNAELFVALANDGLRDEDLSELYSYPVKQRVPMSWWMVMRNIQYEISDEEERLYLVREIVNPYFAIWACIAEQCINEQLFALAFEDEAILKKLKEMPEQVEV